MSGYWTKCVSGLVNWEWIWSGIMEFIPDHSITPFHWFILSLRISCIKRSIQNCACFKLSIFMSSFERTYSSWPAKSLGFEVVDCLTCLCTWQRHLCTFVVGHFCATAEAKPLPPSVTTILGGAIRESKACQARVVSAFARYQDNTYLSTGWFFKWNVAGF